MKTIQDMTIDLLEDFSEPQLAKKVDTSQTQINRIKKGQEPGFTLGKRIESLYLSKKSENQAA